jgi:hypothetical protein
MTTASPSAVQVREQPSAVTVSGVIVIDVVPIV